MELVEYAISINKFVIDYTFRRNSLFVYFDHVLYLLYLFLSVVDLSLSCLKLPRF